MKIFIFALVLVVITLNLVANDLSEFEITKSYIGNKFYYLAENELQHFLNSDNIFIREESLFHYAMLSFYEKNYDKAISLFSLLLLQFPFSIYREKVKFYIALSFYYTGNYLVCIRELNRFIKNYPDSRFLPQAYLYLGRSYFKMQYTERSIEIISHALARLKHTEDNLELELELARIYFFEEDYDRAISQLKKIIVSYPLQNVDKIQLWMAECFKKKKEYLRAFKRFSTVYSTGNENLKKIALLNMGYLSFLTENYDDVINFFETYRKKYRWDKQNYGYLFLLAYTYYLKEKYEKALALLNLIVNQNYNELLTYNALLLKANILLKEFKFKSAIKVLKKGLEIKGINRFFLFVTIAEVYLKMGYYHNAEEYYKKSLKFTTSIINYPEVLYNLSTIYLLQNKFSEAIEVLNSIVEKYPTGKVYLYAFFRLGKIYFLKNMYTKALFYFGKLTDRKFCNIPEINERSFEYLVTIYIKQGRYNEALKLIKTEKFKRENLKLLEALVNIKLRNFKKAKSILINLINSSERKEIKKILKTVIPEKEIDYFNSLNLKEKIFYANILIACGKRLYELGYYNDVIETLLFLTRVNLPSGVMKKVLKLIGDSYINTGKYESAIFYIRKIVKLSLPEEKNKYYFILYELYKKKGNRQSAIEMLKNIIKLAIKDKYYEKALKILEKNK